MKSALSSEINRLCVFVTNRITLIDLWRSGLFWMICVWKVCGCIKHDKKGENRRLNKQSVIMFYALKVCQTELELNSFEKNKTHKYM